MSSNTVKSVLLNAVHLERLARGFQNFSPYREEACYIENLRAAIENSPLSYHVLKVDQIKVIIRYVKQYFGIPIRLSGTKLVLCTNLHHALSCEVLHELPDPDLQPESEYRGGIPTLEYHREYRHNFNRVEDSTGGDNAVNSEVLHEPPDPAPESEYRIRIPTTLDYPGGTRILIRRRPLEPFASSAVQGLCSTNQMPIEQQQQQPTIPSPYHPRLPLSHPDHPGLGSHSPQNHLPNQYYQQDQSRLQQRTDVQHPPTATEVFMHCLPGHLIPQETPNLQPPEESIVNSTQDTALETTHSKTLTDFTRCKWPLERTLDYLGANDLHHKSGASRLLFQNPSFSASQDPFSVVVCQLACFLFGNACGKHMTRQRTERFDVNPSLLPRVRDPRSNCRVECRFFSFTKCCDVVPSYFMELSCNGKLVDITKVHKRFRFRGNQVVIIPRCCNLSPYVVSRNTLCFLNPHEVVMGAAVVQVVESVPLEELMKRVSHVPGGLIELCSHKDRDLQETLLRISLRCPLSLRRIRRPVRGKKCVHFQCFDLEMYLRYCDQQRVWQCPVCQLALPYGELVEDQFFCKILSDVKAEDVPRINMYPDGHWTLDSLNDELPRNDLVSLVKSDDENHDGKTLDSTPIPPAKRQQAESSTTEQAVDLMETGVGCEESSLAFMSEVMDESDNESNSSEELFYIPETQFSARSSLPFGTEKPNGGTLDQPIVLSDSQ